MGIAKSMTSGQRAKGDGHLLNLYETPPEATHALLKAEKLPKVLWEASCGPGAIVRVLRGAGHEVLATDLQDYHSPDQDLTNFDFMQQHDLPYAGIGAIIQNPPFNRANDFVRRSLELCPRVYMLLRIQYLESTGRADLLDMLARIHVFSNRLPMLHRHGWDGPRASNTQCFAWYVFDRHHRGPTSLYRMKWEPVHLVKM